MYFILILSGASRADGEQGAARCMSVSAIEGGLGIKEGQRGVVAAGGTSIRTLRLGAACFKEAWFTQALSRECFGTGFPICLESESCRWRAGMRVKW